MPAFWKVGACIFLLLFTGQLSPILAARSMTISANKTVLFGDEELLITASISGFADEEEIVVKTAFYKEGESNYFGYTKKSDMWVKNGETTKEQKVIVVKDWDKLLVAKADFSDSGYKGEGEYKVKVGYYYKTPSSDYGSVRWSENSLSVSMSEPDPTPTNSITPTFSPTPSNTPTPHPTVTITETVTPTVTVPSSFPVPISIEAVENDVLGATVIENSPAKQDRPTSTQAGVMKQTQSKKPFIIFFLMLGISTSAATVVYVLRSEFSGSLFTNKQ